MEKETYHAKYQQIFEPGCNVTINNEPVFNGTVIQGGGQQQQVQHFPLCRSDKSLKQLYQFLVNKGWIAGNTHPDNFVYIMGGIERSPQVKAVQWLQSVQLLREMLEGVFAPVIERGVIKKADLERITPFCFADEAGKPIALAKARKEPNQESELLANFLPTIL